MSSTPLKLPLKVGWVGVRGYGEKIWQSVSELGDLKVVSCFHPEKNIAQDAAIRMGSQVSESYESLITSREIDAVVLIVPNQVHFPLAKDALSAGKHVFLEKPITNTYQDAVNLKAHAEMCGLKLIVGHNYRYTGYIRAIKEALSAGRIGNIVGGEFNMGHGGGLKWGPSKWRFHASKCPGGSLNILGSHLIDASNYLFGRPVQVSATVKNLFASTTSEDTSFLQLEYEGGEVVNIVNLYNSVSTEYVNIYGTSGALRFSQWPQPSLWYQPKDIDTECANYERVDYKEKDSAKELFEKFIQSILEPDNQFSNIEDAVDVVKVIEAAMQSHRYNKKVSISEISPL